MSDIKQVSKEVGNSYGSIITKEVKGLVPQLLKSIKEPGASINPAAKMRENIISRILVRIAKSRNIEETDPIEISKKIKTNDKVVLSSVLVLCDMISNMIMLEFIPKFAETKFAAAMGKISVNAGLKIAYAKADIDQSVLSTMSDDEKLHKYRTVIYLDTINQYMKSLNRDLNNMGISEISKYVRSIGSAGTRYGDIGATFLIAAFAGSINEEASKHIAQKYNFTKVYFTTFNLMEFTSYVGAALSAGTPLADAIKIRAASVAMHGATTLLHKFNLGWAGYVIHFMWNLFATVPQMLTQNKAKLQLALKTDPEETEPEES